MKARVTIDYLPDGTLPIYESAAWNLLVGEEGDSIIAVTKPKKVIVPLIDLTKDTKEEADARFQELIAALVHAASVEHSGKLYVTAAIRSEASSQGLSHSPFYVFMVGMIITPTPLKIPRPVMLTSLVDFPNV